MLRKLLFIFFSLSLLISTYGQDKKEEESGGKFSGYMFGDYCKYHIQLGPHPSVVTTG